MKWASMRFSGIAVVALLVGSGEVHAQTYQFPADSAVPVITLDYQGDRMRRITDSPVMSIMADGTVMLPQVFAHGRAVSDHISRLELLELLDFVVRDNRFTEIDWGSVLEDEGNRRRMAAPQHLSTTVIQLHLDNRRYEVRFSALDERTSNVEIALLHAVKRRLDQQMTTAKLGGKAGVSHWLGLANNALESKLRDAELFDVTNLESGGARPDGSSYALFSRHDKGHSTNVAIYVSASGETHTTVARDGVEL